jgi:hypothetical protein
MTRTLWLALALLGCSGDGKDGPQREPEICTDGIDNDLDGFADCEDSDCFVGCIEECTNGVDDDDNGLVDCLDPACFGGLCSEICDDGGDNDLDGDADCLDSDCVDECPETCDDGVDNDGDNQIDCADPDCDSTCDADGDGVIAEAYGGEDCDDADPDNYPGNSEVCDTVDNDCDLLVDDADPGVVASTTWYVDDDGDGYGGASISRCSQPTGTVAQSGDCDDDDPAVNPDAIEICNDGVDDDCSGQADDADPTLDLGSLISWYPDADLDGWGVPGPTIEQCAQPFGYADNDLDCNDSNPGILGEEPWLDDNDNDGFGAGTPSPPSCTQPAPGTVRESFGLDCDDTDRFTYPGAYEICGDGTDQDCDGIDPSCVLDQAVTASRVGSAIVDVTGGTFDGEEALEFVGNGSGTVYCEFTYQTQDWDNSPLGGGVNPISQVCTDPDGNACLWAFTIVLDGGFTTNGDPADCAVTYGLQLPSAPYSPAGYGWSDNYMSGGVNFGPAWVYYYSGGPLLPVPTWIGLAPAIKSFNATTGQFDYIIATDTAAPVPP